MKKKIKKKFNTSIPNNYAYWVITVSRPDEIDQFLERGDKNQWDSMLHTLIYMEKIDPERFKEIKGKKTIKKIKEKI